MQNFTYWNNQIDPLENGFQQYDTLIKKDRVPSLPTTQQNKYLYDRV